MNKYMAFLVGVNAVCLGINLVSTHPFSKYVIIINVFGLLFCWFNITD